MTATLFTPPLEIIHLSGISWQTYETLRSELSNRRIRLTYKTHLTSRSRRDPWVL